jgi:hypothetical protein
MKHIKIALALLGAFTALSLSSCGEKYYKVRFLNDDGSVLFETDQVLENATPVYQGNTPLKAKTDQYTYTFKGWDKAIAPATADADYTATYESAVNQYQVRFVNYDDALITAVNVPYDGTAVFPDTGNAPEKPSNDQYSYAFNGWDEPLEHITKDVTRKALFTETVRTYKVEYKNFDGTLLDTQNIEYGKNAHFAKESPKKASDESYDYIFSGWDYPETNIVKDMVLTAQFSQARNSFSVTFVNDDNSVLDTVKVAKGGTAVYAKDVPTKAQDEQYTYTFAHWDYPLEGITEDCTRKAVYDHALREYDVVYKNWDGSELESGKVKYGQNAEYTEAAPTKPEDELHTYAFQGWDKPETNIVKDTVFTALFKDILRQYTATFYDGDNKLVYTAVVDAGADAVYQGAIPTKASDEKNDYAFKEWDKPLTDIRADTAFHATFEATLKTFYVSFKNEDGTLLKTETVKYGETVAYNGATPTKEKTAQHSYAFSSWDKPLENITNNCDRYAQYVSSVNQYTVNFVNYDGSTLQTNTVDYGSSVEYSGVKPTKPADDDYGYVFTGWDNATSTITGDVTATAQFSKADYLDYVLSADETYYIVYKSATATLPETVAIPTQYKNKPVKAIGGSAFEQTSIASIIIADSVTSIGNSAFASCSSLSSVSIPSSVTSIGDSAFYGCSSLSSVSIPSSVTSIGDSAFYGCSSLSSVSIPSSVTSIGYCAFQWCSSLSSVSIPSSVTSIGRFAFYGCSSLSSVSIPSSVTSIAAYTFDGCSSLSSVSIPSSVTSIGDGAFYGCSSLSSVSIPSSVTSIGDSAFYGCSSLSSVSIPSSVTSIGYCAFHDCTLLSAVSYGGTIAAFTAAVGSNPSNLFWSTRVPYVQCSNGKVTLS